MRTEVTELPDSRVRVDVTVDAETFRREVDKAARAAARDIRVPGFRKGKVPPHFVIQRVGWEGIADQAIRDSLGDWYEQALIAGDVQAVGDPSISGLDGIPAEGEDLSFAIEIGVLPKAKLGQYRELEVEMPSSEPTDEQVDAELERLRTGLGSLSPVERPIHDGDIVAAAVEATVDGESFEGSKRDNHIFDLSSEDTPEAIRAQLPGHEVGDEVTIDVELGPELGPGELAGGTATYAITVKEVRERNLPELDDELARSASEFDTLEELRDDIRTRLAGILETRAERDFRDRAIEAAISNSEVELTEELIHGRAHELWERFERQLEASGIDMKAYAEAQGKTRHELIDDHQDDAAASLRRDSVLTSIAEAEAIEPTDDDLLEALGATIPASSGDKLLRELRKTGRDTVVIGQVKLRKAADLVAETARPIPAPADAPEADSADG